MTDSELIADHFGGHSALQMDCFITVRAGGTPYGCYKQALREWHKRHCAMRLAEYDRELCLLDIEAIEQARPKTQRGERRRQNRLGRKRMELDNSDKNTADLRRELMHFRAQCERYRAMLGDDFHEKRDRLDAEMWLFHSLEDSAMDLLSGGWLQKMTAAHIRVLPQEYRDFILEMLKPANRESLVNWWMQYRPDSHSMPKPNENPRLRQGSCQIRGDRPDGQPVGIPNAADRL